MRLAALVFATFAAGCPGVCGTINFSGSGSSGSIAPNALPWSLLPASENLFRGVSVWGVPGFGNGNATWPSGNGNALSFTITFTGLPGGVSIDQTPDPNPTGANDFTRFHRGDDGVIWIPGYTGGNSVTFTAPIIMPAGTDFFVNVAFTGDVGSSVSFTGNWDTDVKAVPEPGSFGLLAVAILAAGIFFGKRSRRPAELHR